jgi:hypothetical protein
MIKTGNILIFIGVSMWGVYAVGKYLLGWDITDRQVLPYHLMMIIPGMLLRHYSGMLAKFFGRSGRDGNGDGNGAT